MIAWIALLLAQEAAPTFSKFEFSRERIEHKVVVDAVLVNPYLADLTDVRLAITYFEGDRELRRSKVADLARVPAGGTAPVKIEAVQVPNFDRYELILEHGGTKRLVYTGKESAPLPVLRTLPARLVLASHQAEGGTLRLVVRNVGEREAREPTAVLGKARLPLGDAVKPGFEEAYEISGAEAGEPRLAWLAAEVPAPAEPRGEPKELVLRKVRIVRLTDGSARVTGALKNGHPSAVNKIQVSLQLGKTSFPVPVPGAIKPGAERALDVYVPDCPAFTEFSFGLNYADMAKPEEPPPAKAPVVKKIASRDVSAELAAAQPVKRLEKEAPAQAGAPKGPALSVEVKGVQWIKGYVVKGHYTGDVAYLRLLFRDAEGKPAQPIGSTTVIVYDGEKPYKRVPRNITRDSYKINTAKINADTANHEAVAHDPRTGEVWVGLVRTEGTGFIDLRADVSLTLKEFGTWIWKGLADPWESPAKGPDKK